MNLAAKEISRHAVVTLRRCHSGKSRTRPHRCCRPPPSCSSTTSIVCCFVEDANTGYWITVGGAVDPDEPPADAAVRECWEELGLLVEPTRLIGVFAGPHFRSNYANGDTVSYVATVFEVRKVRGEPKPDGVEITRMRYVSRDEAKTLKMSVATREMVDYAFNFDGTPYFSKPAWQPPR